MASPPTSPEKLNRAVVAYRDGRRLKGYILNFSALKDKFRLFSGEPGKQQAGVDVVLNDLKAIFFVKNFEGDASYNETRTAEAPKHRRKLTVTFGDGTQRSGSNRVAHVYKRSGLFHITITAADRAGNKLAVTRTAVVR